MLFTIAPKYEITIRTPKSGEKNFINFRMLKNKTKGDLNKWKHVTN